MAPLASTLSLISTLLTLSQFAAAHTPGTLGFDFERRAAEPELTLRRSGLWKRAGQAQATIYNAEGGALYLINVTVGTPPQSLSLQLDTGSSDTWVPYVGSQACAQQKVCADGSYDPTKSSTFAEVLKNQFDISYADGTEIQGDYINETVSVAGVTLKSVTMAVAKQASLPNSQPGQPFQGILGVAFDDGESIFDESGGQVQYADITSQMVLQGVISTRAYSLWLNTLDATSGSILFGGVDTSKYTGDLIALPLQVTPETGLVDSFAVTFAGIELDGAGGKSVYSANSNVAVILDSGTSLTYVPDVIANAILTGVGAQNSDELGYIVPCSLASSGGVFKFKFGNANGPVISALISQFVIPFTTNGTGPKFGATNEEACTWGIWPSGGSFNLLGDTFLRSAYVVYDLDGKQIAIGETNFNPGNANVQAITNTNVPGATSTATGSAAAQTESGSPIGTDLPFGFGGSSTLAVGTSVPTNTFDLGSATTTINPASGGSGGGASSTAHPGAAAGYAAPSSSFVGTLVFGVVSLLGMLGGSMLIFA